MTQLTPHFTTEEFERSATAERLGITNKIPAAHVRNVYALCANVLEHVREYFCVPVVITSGYRSIELLAALEREGKDPAKDSQHCEGKAADIQVEGVAAIVVFKWIVANCFFDQCIYEMELDADGNTTAIWVHVSFNGAKNRRQALKGVRQNGRTRYINFKG